MLQYYNLQEQCKQWQVKLESDGAMPRGIGRVLISRTLAFDRVGG